MPGKTSIIFVAGAWHGEYHLQPALPYLDKHGYRVVPVKLRTSGNHDPLPVVQDNIDAVEKIIQAEVEAGYQICVIGHSVSGHTVAGAVNTFLKTASAAAKAQLVHIILIACFFDPLRTLAEQDWYEIDFDTLWVTIIRPAEEIFYNDMPREEAQPFVAALDVNRAQMPPELSDEWKTQVNVTYFLCKKDEAVPPKFQKLEAEENNFELVEVDMDHCPMVSRPRELAEKINEVLKVYN